MHDEKLNEYREKLNKEVDEQLKAAEKEIDEKLLSLERKIKFFTPIRNFIVKYFDPFLILFAPILVAVTAGSMIVNGPSVIGFLAMAALIYGATGALRDVIKQNVKDAVKEMIQEAFIESVIKDLKSDIEGK